MATYHSLSQELQNRITEDRQQHRENPYACRDEQIIRRHAKHDHANIWRPAFVRDTEKIMHLPYYNRYSDKTQVFSFYKNDDISRRAQHVQLVSRIARNIGSVLNLNLDLIEAISLGHDIGHTPFGHEGERILSRLYHEQTGRYFNHNVHSVRVLDGIVHRNISLQTLDGIICHNGELEQQRYTPHTLESFEQFDECVERCYTNQSEITRLVPSTLEACVMRICDIIAYLGKDRQDAIRLGMVPSEQIFAEGAIGNTNAEIINNLIVNIIENSYGQPYLSMDKEYFAALQTAKAQNYQYIYGNPETERMFAENIEPMFEDIYHRLLQEVLEEKTDSMIYRQHFALIASMNAYSADFCMEDYRKQKPNEIVVDFIASMTDDYFIDLYHHLFPDGKYQVHYVGYFE